jgi:hypothetical protein
MCNRAMAAGLFAASTAALVGSYFLVAGFVKAFYYFKNLSI